MGLFGLAGRSDTRELIPIRPRETTNQLFQVVNLLFEFPRHTIDVTANNVPD